MSDVRGSLQLATYALIRNSKSVASSRKSLKSVEGTSIESESRTLFYDPKMYFGMRDSSITQSKSFLNSRKSDLSKSFLKFSRKSDLSKSLLRSARKSDLSKSLLKSTRKSDLSKKLDQEVMRLSFNSESVLHSKRTEERAISFSHNECSDSLDENSDSDHSEFEFVSLYDPGIDEAFAYRRVPQKIYADDGQELFLDKIREDDLYFSKRFYNGLKQESIDLQFSLVESMCFMPMCLALENNHTVTSLNLKGNQLTPDACYHLSLLISTNQTLTELNLSACRMGPKGALKMGDSLEYTQTIKTLDLSCNELEDAGLQCLIIGLGYNKSIINLNLSNNKLTNLSGWHLAEIFKENSNILDVDLSWNNLMNKEQGIKFFLNSLCKLNETLESINFAWNGLHGDNVPSFFKTFLVRYKFIKHLDLSNNRLQGKIAVDQFSRGINSSTTLETLDLSYNPFQIEHIMNFISKIAKSKTLKKLLFSNFWLTRKIYKTAVEIHDKGGPLLVIEGLLGIKEEEVSNEIAQTLLLKRAHYLGLKPKKKKKRKEFGHFLLKLQEEDKLKPLKKKAFLKLFTQQKLLIDDKMENEFVKRFKVPDKKNVIDVPLILELYMKLFPSTALPKKKGKAVVTAGDIVKQLLEKLIDNAVGGVKLTGESTKTKQKASKKNLKKK